MTTPVFPLTLPGVSSLSWTADVQVQQSEGDIVGTYNRRRTSRVPSAEAGVSWTFLEGDYAIFQEFWKTDLIRGHRWFMLILPCAAGYAAHVVRFKKHRAAKSEGYTHVTVSATLAVRERKLRPDTIFSYLTSTPYPIYGFEGVDVRMAIISASLGAISYSDFEGVNPGLLPTTAAMYVALKTQDQGHEDIDVGVLPVSGTLKDTLKTYTLDPEGVDSQISIVSATMRDALIVNTVPAEGVDPTLSIISGTLV